MVEEIVKEGEGERVAKSYFGEFEGTKIKER